MSEAEGDDMMSGIVSVGEGTGRYDRGSVEAGAVVLRDPVHRGEISTHDLYGPATPNVGSAWALPRNHPLWAPMDFEVKEKKQIVKKKEFDPPPTRPQLTPQQIDEVRSRNREAFRKKKKNCDERVTFIAQDSFRGRRPGYYWGRGDQGVGYHMDYAQMRHLMSLDVADRCEARYKGVRRYFNGIVIKTRDEDCTYDVKFQHGHVELHIPCEHVRKSNWVGEIKEAHQGMARSLKAANPLLETKDKAVQWYEQLLMWEQGRIEEPLPPEGLFSPQRQPDSSCENEKVGRAKSLLLDGEEKEEQREEVVLLSRVEEVVASGDVWKPESSGYKRIWDQEGYPHRSGPPTAATTDDSVDCGWYGRSEQSEKELSATREKPFSLSEGVNKWIVTKGTGEKPIAGRVAKCHLIGTKVDGAIFETSHDSGPRSFRLFQDEDANGVPRARRYIQGLHEAIASMRVGEIAHFVVAPEKGYGRKGRYPSIPGYSKESPRGTTLCYELELLEILEDDRDSTALVDPSTFGLLERPRGYEWESIEEEAEKRCGRCGKPERTLLRGQRFQRCGKCKTRLYCGSGCAKADWPSHKLTCCSPQDNDVLAAVVNTSSSASSDGGEDAIVEYLMSSSGRDRKPRVCVIAAYRNQLPLQDRQGQLFKFVPYMAAFLGSARPPCDFTIVIATQTDDGRKFNRGRLMNAAFRELSQENGEYDSVIFHDIDILPSEDLMPYYSVPPSAGCPMHLGGAWRTKFKDPHFVGGAIAFRPEDFARCNGFPNDCWGWGLDDEELGLRMKEAGLKVVRPFGGSYSDLDPINLRNIVLSEERGYYHEWWNMDMENGKCKPKVTGKIHWDLYSRWWRERGLCDIAGNSELVARTTEFGGRVVRLLYALENDQERKEGTVALVGAKISMRASVEHAHLLTGHVAENAMKQTHALAAQGNLKRDQPRLMYHNKNLLTPDETRRLRQGGAERTKTDRAIQQGARRRLG